jgi:hypothetical protein
MASNKKSYDKDYNKDHARVPIARELNEGLRIAFGRRKNRRVNLELRRVLKRHKEEQTGKPDSSERQ